MKKGWKQRKHTRISVIGTTFSAGKKLPKISNAEQLKAAYDYIPSSRDLTYTKEDQAKFEKERIKAWMLDVKKMTNDGLNNALSHFKEISKTDTTQDKNLYGSIYLIIKTELDQRKKSEPYPDNVDAIKVKRAVLQAYRDVSEATRNESDETFSTMIKDWMRDASAVDMLNEKERKFAYRLIDEGNW